MKLIQCTKHFDTEFRITGLPCSLCESLAGYLSSHVVPFSTCDLINRHFPMWGNNCHISLASRNRPIERSFDSRNNSRNNRT